MQAHAQPRLNSPINHSIVIKVANGSKNQPKKLIVACVIVIISGGILL